MVLDSSAVLAVLLDEAESRRFIEAIAEAPRCAMSVASFVETSIVIEARFGAEGSRDLDLFLDRARVELMSVDREQGALARQGYNRFGKGRHPAGLNFGDCFAYALARQIGEPLLFKGADFRHTDVAAAV